MRRAGAPIARDLLLGSMMTPVLAYGRAWCVFVGWWLGWGSVVELKSVFVN